MSIQVPALVFPTAKSWSASRLSPPPPPIGDPSALHAVDAPPRPSDVRRLYPRLPPLPLLRQPPKTKEPKEPKEPKEKEPKVPGAGLPAGLVKLLRSGDEGPFTANEVFSSPPTQPLAAVEEDFPATEWYAITRGRALADFAISGVAHYARKALPHPGRGAVGIQQDPRLGGRPSHLDLISALLCRRGGAQKIEIPPPPRSWLRLPIRKSPKIPETKARRPGNPVLRVTPPTTYPIWLPANRIQAILFVPSIIDPYYYFRRAVKPVLAIRCNCGPYPSHIMSVLAADSTCFAPLPCNQTRFSNQPTSKTIPTSWISHTNSSSLKSFSSVPNLLSLTFGLGDPWMYIRV
ncbi:hypothetical protein R3P38DRAFT_3224404 [Favolaschia claudopus]|uniref:Uncharacterized protein n=1 Tax=Favolaschia claudopus TaxID=2862362 RepID=A0AAV9ZWH9_9AGAR